MLRKLVPSVPHWLRTFARDSEGVTAVEFALIAPLMVGLYLGVVVFSSGIAIGRKVTLAARSVADLASQTKSISSSTEVISMFNAVDKIIEPYGKTSFKFIVSQVAVDNNGNAKIEWSDARNTNQRAQNQDVTSLVPSTFRTPNTWIIWGEAQYDYTPIFGKTILSHTYTWPFPIQDQIFMRARQSTSVTQSWAGGKYDR